MYTVGIDLFTGALAMGRNNNSSHQKYSLLELVPYLDVFSLLSTTSEEKKTMMCLVESHTTHAQTYGKYDLER